MKKTLFVVLILLTACSPVAKGTVPVPSDPEADSGTSSLSNIPDDTTVDVLANLPEPVCESMPTPEDQEGPYFKAGSPETSTLYEQGMEGKKLILVGFVVNKNCLPIPNTLLDFWQADSKGNYDNDGYTLRGHQLSDNKGRYLLETIFPGKYASRPIEHIHVKVQPPNGQILTTQLYFPAQPVENLTVQLEDRGDHYLAIFNFVMP